MVYEREGGGLGRVLTRTNVARMNAMLAYTVTNGTGRRAQIDRPAAGKTGTSQENRDAWFLGYTADLVAGVWVGNDDDTPMARVTGGGLPATLWHDMMVIAHENLEPEALAGAGSLVTLSPQTRQRIAFYRDVGNAFAGTQSN